MTLRRSRVRLAAVCAALLPVVCGCGIQASGVAMLGPAPSVPAGQPQPTPAGGADSAFTLYFMIDGQWSPVYRSATGPVTESTVLASLLAGPTPAEAKAGYVSALQPTLKVFPNADGLRYSYSLSEPVTPDGKTELVCTMQNYDDSLSVGVIELGSSVPIWLGCQDTTNQYVPPPVYSPGAESTTPATPAAG